MQQNRLLFGLAAVLAGIATLMLVLGFVYTPALFAIALTFGASAYFVWYQASGRLRERVERGRAGSYRRAGADAGTETDRGGFGAGPRDSFSGRRGGFGSRETGGRADPGAGRRARAGGRAGTGRARQSSGPSPAEAYRVLGLDADADADAVKQAYRRKVKSVHPDSESGDEDEFKRVKEAYEVLNDRD